MQRLINGELVEMQVLADPSGVPYRADLSSGAVAIAPAASGGLSTWMIDSTADTNLRSVKPSPGQVYGWQLQNKSASPVRVTFYDKISAPNIAADNGLRRLLVRVPSGGISSMSRGQGIAFAAGIAYAITTDAGAPVAASDLCGSVEYF